MAKYEDIERFTRSSGYCVTVDWRHIEHTLKHYEEWKLDIDPVFQRGYVWTPEQQTRYVEYVLKGGHSSRDIYTNCPGWSRGRVGNFTVVDGKQRLTAALDFLQNKVSVFGDLYARDFTDLLPSCAYFNWHVNELETPLQVYQWYLDLNTGGTVHTPKDLDKVRALIEEERRSPTVYVAEPEPPKSEHITTSGTPKKKAVKRTIKATVPCPECSKYDPGFVDGFLVGKPCSTCKKPMGVKG